MATVNFIGKQASYLRCYRLSYSDSVLHLKSGQSFSSVNAIRRAVDRVSNAGRDNQSAVLFVERQHLPLEVIPPTSVADAFNRFCDFIGFTTEVNRLTLGQGNLPRSTDDHVRARFTHTPGFPVVQAASRVDLNKSLSFDEVELRNFLGAMYPSAGRLMIVNLNDANGHPMLPLALATTINHFSLILQTS